MALLLKTSSMGRRHISAADTFTFYVDSTASAGGNGSLATPWNSLTQVNNATLTPGQSVGFKRGQSWTGGFSITENGASGSRIRLGAYGTGARPIIDRNNTSNHTIDITGDYITVEDLDVRNAGINSDGGEWANVSFNSGAIFGIVQRCRLANGQIGVRFQSSSTDGLVTGCDFDSNNKMVVDTVGGDDDYGAHAIFIGNACHRTEVNYNTSTGHVHTSSDYGFDGSFCEIFAASDCVIHHNKSTNDLTFCELGRNTSDPAADNNLIYHNLITATAAVGSGQALGIITRGVGGFGPVYGTVIEHNTLHILGASGQGIVVGGTTGTSFIARIRNNIIVTANTAIAVNNTGTTTATHNVYAGTHQATVGTGSTNSSTPGWVNSAGGDYHLTSTAIARDTGLGGLGYTTDLDGNPIQGTPDRGCYEYQP